MLGHVVLQLRRPLAFVAAECTEIFLLFFVDPHVKLENTITTIHNRKTTLHGVEEEIVLKELLHLELTCIL